VYGGSQSGGGVGGFGQRHYGHLDDDLGPNYNDYNTEPVYGVGSGALRRYRYGLNR
jgi:hypothetical protein